MKTFFKLITVIPLLLGVPGHVYAYYGDGKPLLCAFQSLSECIAGHDCQQVSPGSINLPDFILVDHAQKFISAAPGTGSERKTAIERGEQLDGRLILQGGDDGHKEQRDGLAWSLSIDDVSGKMIVSAVGDGFAVVAFGACVVK